MSWVDNLVVTAVVVFGLFIMYRALQEPMDAFFGAVKRGLIWIKDKIVDAKDDAGYEVIQYG